MEIIFIDLGLAIILATLLGIVAKMIRQPLIIAYIVAGFLLGSSFVGFSQSKEMISLFSTMGITFLLFIVGTEISVGKIAEVGLKSFLIGAVQVIFTGAGGYLVGRVLGLDLLPSFYLGIVAAFSSTVIVIKLLSEKRHLSSMYGKLVVGILVLQDILALVALVILSSIGSDFDISPDIFLNILVRGLLLGIIIYIFSRFILDRLFRYLAKSVELLFLASIAWCFAVTGLFFLSGFSMEMGALVAGISIAPLAYSEEIRLRLSSLKDFFLILFFIGLGMQMDFVGVNLTIWPIVLLSMVVIFLKPLSVMITMSAMGFAKRTSFYTAISLSQMSEFSLIVAGLGLALGHLDKTVFSLIIVVMIISVLVSSYLITFLGNIYALAKKALVLFERDGHLEYQGSLEYKNHAVLFGYHRLGSRIVHALKKNCKKIIVVDLDPEAIEHLTAKNIPCVYGDAYDVELLVTVNVASAKIIVTTIPAKRSNAYLIKKIREVNKRVAIIAIADQAEDAIFLYKAGADYVVLPHYISADHVIKMITKISQKAQLSKIRKKHIIDLGNMIN